MPARARSSGWTHRRAWDVYARGVRGEDLDTPNVAAFGPDGILYVTCSGEDDRPEIVRVPPGGKTERWTVAVPRYPNGCLVTPDGSALVVVEAKAERVVRVPILLDGSAGEPETVAELPDTDADGISLAADGSCWVTLYRPDGLVRIAPDGSVETSSMTISRRTSTRPRTSRGSARRSIEPSSPTWAAASVDRGHRSGRTTPALPGGAVMARFTDRNVIVTGAAQGIGRGIVEAFLAEGASVFAADVRADGLERMRAAASRTRAGLDPRRRSGRLRCGEGYGARGDRAPGSHPCVGQLRRRHAWRTADRRDAGDVRSDVRGQRASADGDDAGRRGEHGRAWWRVPS